MTVTALPTLPLAAPAASRPAPSSRAVDDARVACPVPEAQAHQLLDDELPPDGAARLRAHLAACADCRTRVAHLERLLATVRRQRTPDVRAPERLLRRARAIAREVGRDDRATEPPGSA